MVEESKNFSQKDSLKSISTCEVIKTCQEAEENKEEENKYNWETYDSRALVNELGASFQKFQDQWAEMQRQMVEKLKGQFQADFKVWNEYENRPQKKTPVEAA